MAKPPDRSEGVMRVVRHFILHSLMYIILFPARHIPAMSNGIADAISLSAPEAAALPDQVPAELWALGVKN